MNTPRQEVLWYMDYAVTYKPGLVAMDLLDQALEIAR